MDDGLELSAVDEGGRPGATVPVYCRGRSEAGAGDGEKKARPARCGACRRDRGQRWYGIRPGCACPDGEGERAGGAPSRAGGEHADLGSSSTEDIARMD